jgi:energy-coupling factor transport system permease protein
LVHRTDTRVKLLVLFSYLAGVFMLQSWAGLLLFAALLLAAYFSARIPVKMALRSLAPLVAILVFTLVANGFGFSAARIVPPPLLPWLGYSDTSVVYSFVPLVGGFGFRLYGFMRGLFLTLRIFCLVLVTALLTYTSTTVALSDAIVSLLRPLAALGAPTEDLALVFNIALRFISLITNETERLITAQQARGAVFDKGGPVQRGRAWLPVLIPLFVKLFRRSERLAAAMDTRCYRGQGRTHLRANVLRVSALVIGLLFSCALIAVGVVC